MNDTYPHSDFEPGGILIIDDDVDFANSVRDLLRTDGHSVVIASDAQAALAELERFHFSVALIDYRLCQVRGTELVPLLKEQVPHLACVMVTAYASTEMVVEALRLGAYDVLSKPVKADDLWATLARCFDRARLEDTTRRAQEALRASEQRFRDFTEVAADWFWEIDAEHRITYVSEPFSERTGVSEENYLGRNRIEFYRDIGVDEAWLEAYQEIWDERRPYRQLTLTMRRPDNDEVVMISTSGKPVLDQEGAFVGYRGVSSDVTGRIRAEQALSQSEARFRDFAEIGSDWFWETDKDHRFIFVSGQGRLVADAAEVLLGLTREEILGSRVRATPATEELVRTMSDLAPYQDCHIEWMTGEGEVLHIRHSGRPYFGEDGSFAGYRAVARDVSDEVRASAARSRLETQLRHAQKMESVGRLAGGLAHDFNNILGSVIGYLELSLGYHVPDSNQKLVRYLNESQRAAERAKALVRQLLLYSRGGDGELAPHSPADMIRDAGNLLRSSVSPGVTISYDLDERLPSLNAHPVQLGQVLMNLCANASRAQSDRGEIRISAKLRNLERARCASCSLEVDGSYVVLEVRDQGVGISPSVQMRMFEPFFSTFSPDGGSGMGLAVVHGIVHDHDGHVLVHSREGKGTAVQVLLPHGEVEPSQAGESSTPPADSQFAGRHVLVADDELGFGEFVRDLLSAHGCTVDVETDGRAARDRFRRLPHAFDVVIADFVMPGLTGTELAESLLHTRPDVPIILCTGVLEQVSEADTAALGIRAVLRKPVTSAALLSHLSRCW